MSPGSFELVRRGGVISRNVAVSFFCLTGLVACTAQPRDFTQPPPSRSGPALLGTYLGAGCTGGGRIKEFERWLGRPVDQVLDFINMTSWKEFESSSRWIADCWGGSKHKMVLSVPMLPKDGRSNFADAAAGDYDLYFANLARTLVARGYGDTILRPGWEMNAKWYPWSALKDPQGFVTQWRRIVKIMRSVPGGNFRFDWSPIVEDASASPEAAYPGDDVVDIIGADVYNQTWDKTATTPEIKWTRLLNAPYGLKWHQRFAQAHGKPMSYAEWGTGIRPDGHGGGDDPYFMQQMAAWIQSNNVAYHNYWDYPAHDFNGRLSDGSKPAAAAVFLRMFGGPGAAVAR